MAPLACLAIFPVSRISGRPPTSIVTECGAGVCLFSDICGSSFDSSSEECTKQAWPAIDKEEKKGLFASGNAVERRSPGETPIGPPKRAWHDHNQRRQLWCADPERNLCVREFAGNAAVRSGGLLAQAKAVNNLVIPIRVAAVEIVQQTAALVHHHDEPAARSVVLDVRLQVRRQIVDALAQKRDLHLWRSRILHMRPVLLDQHSSGVAQVPLTVVP